MTPKQRDLLCRIAHHGVRVPPTYGPGIALVGMGLAYRRKGYLRLTTAGELRADALGLYGQGQMLARVWRLLVASPLPVAEIAKATGATWWRVRQVLAEAEALGMVRRAPAKSKRRGPRRAGRIWLARRAA